MQGFRELLVKYNERSRCPRMMFMKPHSVREKVKEKPPDRTLFVVGVPSYYTEETFKTLFKPYGNVTAVYLHKNPTVQAPPAEESVFFRKVPPHIPGFKVAYVVFENSKTLEKVMDVEEVLTLPPNSTLTGMKKWCEEYNKRVPNVVRLGVEIKRYMDKFDEDAAKQIEKDKKLMEKDEEGWITVTRRSKKRGFARKESVKNHLEKKSEKQKKKSELTDFYTFQIKESKMKNLIALRKKFEEDKRKIASLKQTRRFKPF